jgi:uncharacterized protein YpiB (UPF0302 family)
MNGEYTQELQLIAKAIMEKNELIKEQNKLLQSIDETLQKMWSAIT